MKHKITTLLSLLFIIGVAFVGIEYYSYIFARTVKGRISAIDRLTQPNAIINSGTPIPASQVFSFAVAIKNDQGEIVTASSEDRQWGVAEKGQCAEAKFFPYPPWHLEKSGTYFGARLLRLFDCSGKDSSTIH